VTAGTVLVTAGSVTVIAAIVVIPLGSVTVTAGRVVVKAGEVTVAAGWVKATVTVLVAEQAPAAKTRKIGSTDNALIKTVFMRFTSFKSE
jgi:hypothetical protein